MSLSIPKPILVSRTSIPSPILVKKQSGIPSPILVRPGSSATAAINMNSTTVHANVLRQVNSFFQVSRAASAMGPMNPERFPSTDVTPKNEFGVNRTAYDVNGELWVKSSPIAPNAKASWFDLGKMPAA